MFFIRLFLVNTFKKESGVTVLVWEKRSIYFAIRLSLREISYVLYAHGLLRARNLVPRAHVSFGLGADQKTRGLWERDWRAR